MYPFRFDILGVLILMLTVAVGCAPDRRVRRTLPLPVGPAQGVYSDEAAGGVGATHRGFLQLRGPEGALQKVTWQKRSESIGKPNDGELLDGVLFPEVGPGWACKKGFAYGTDETVRILDWAFQDVFRRFPKTVPLVVGDISAEKGGKLKRHNSHQSGRDVDIGYYALDNRRLSGFAHMTEANFDAEKTWVLVENFLMTGYVRYIFMSYRLQELLYEDALASGWNSDDLEKIFQYPRGHRVRKGIIRHAKGHQDHFHIRFKCAASDRKCVN